MARLVTADKAAIARDYAAGESLPMVAEKHGVSRSTARLIAKEAGVLRERGDAIRLAADSGRLGAAQRGKKRNFTTEQKANMRAAAIARGERMAKGLSTKPNGYVEVTRGQHKGRSQHQVVAEEMLGRPLRPDEVVHHKDRNRANNDPANLEVMTRSEHMALHRREKH